MGHTRDVAHPWVMAGCWVPSPLPCRGCPSSTAWLWLVPRQKLGQSYLQALTIIKSHLSKYLRAWLEGQRLSYPEHAWGSIREPSQGSILPLPYDFCLFPPVLHGCALLLAPCIHPCTNPCIFPCSPIPPPILSSLSAYPSLHLSIPITAPIPASPSLHSAPYSTELGHLRSPLSLPCST